MNLNSVGGAWRTEQENTLLLFVPFLVYLHEVACLLGTDEGGDTAIWSHHKRTNSTLTSFLSCPIIAPETFTSKSEFGSLKCVLCIFKCLKVMERIPTIRTIFLSIVPQPQSWVFKLWFYLGEGICVYSCMCALLFA